MAVSCTPADLAEAAKCFTCLDPAQREIIKTYLLAVIAGGSTDPATLLEEAKCFVCLDPNQRKLINTYLLCQAANGGGVCPEELIVSAPSESEQFFLIGGASLGGVTSLTWNGETAVLGFDLNSMPDLESASFPNLVSIDQNQTNGGFFNIGASSSLTSLELPLLEFVAEYLWMDDLDSITSISLPSLVEVAASSLLFSGSLLLQSFSAPLLVTVGTTFSGSNSPALTTVSVPSYLPTNGRAQNFGGCALSAASVNHILARCVANAGYVSGTITLSGGTSAAPSGQGVADKATLIGRGCTVNTN